MSDAPVLAARDLEKAYRMGTSRLTVLRGVSLTIRPGEVCALMGASGSGKSTLLHLLGLLDRPDRGEVELDGRVVSRVGQTEAARLRAQRIGFVFQQFQLLRELSAFENVLLPRRLARRNGWWRHRRAERARGRAVLAAVGLEGRSRHRPSQLSGGEQQRVAIARALVSEPAVLLADEPTGNLDRQTGEEILQLLLDLARERRAAVLLATHDQEVACRCDRILRLDDGLLASDEPSPAPPVPGEERAPASEPPVADSIPVVGEPEG